MRAVCIADTAFSPLDRELRLERSGLTPHAHECLVRLGAWMPFGHAAEQLEAILGVQVSASTVRRLTEAAGKLCEQHQHAIPNEQEQATAPSPMAMAADGAMVFVRGKGWQEVKTLVLAEVEPQPTKRGSPIREKRTCAHSTFSRLSDAETFGEVCSGEIRRRGIDQAPQVGAIQDGALWLQGFVDLHRHDALRILDFFHAAQYVSAIEEEVRALGAHLPKNWLTGVLHRLKYDGPSRVLTHLEWLVEHFGASPTLQSNLSYLRKRETQMQYPRYQAQGWPIGSGMVESAHKRVLQARLKGAGMQWASTSVNAMLALRMMIDNQRWEQEWQARRDLQRDQQHQQACARQAQRQQQVIEALKPLVAWFLFLQASCQWAKQRADLASSPSSTPPRRRSAFNPWTGDPSKAFALQAKN
jgi:hypothetical protein